MTVLGSRSEPCEPDPALMQILRDLGLPVDQAEGERLIFTVTTEGPDGEPLGVRDVAFETVSNCPPARPTRPVRSKERRRDV